MAKRRPEGVEAQNAGDTAQAEAQLWRAKRLPQLYRAAIGAPVASPGWAKPPRRQGRVASAPPAPPASRKPTPPARQEAARALRPQGIPPPPPGSSRQTRNSLCARPRRSGRTARSPRASAPGPGAARDVAAPDEESARNAASASSGANLLKRWHAACPAIAAAARYRWRPESTRRRRHPEGFSAALREQHLGRASRCLVQPFDRRRHQDFLSARLGARSPRPAHVVSRRQVAPARARPDVWRRRIESADQPGWLGQDRPASRRWMRVAPKRPSA